MAGEPVITIVGNTTAPAELRFTQAGVAVANVTVASTPRTFDKQKNEWVDGETIFMDCSGWRELAENMAETFSDKGMRVVVTGRVRSQSRQDKQTGANRSKLVLDIDDIGPSIKYATAKVTRTQRNNNGGGFGGNQQGQQSNQWGQSSGQNQGSQGQADPWGGAPASSQSWGTPQQDEVPF